jgi:hypothetical protein
MSADQNKEASAVQSETATTFVEIVGALVGDFDVIEVLTALTSRAVKLLNAAAASVLLADDDGLLCVVGASNEQIELPELSKFRRTKGRAWIATSKVKSSSTPISARCRDGLGSLKSA